MTAIFMFIFTFTRFGLTLGSLTFLAPLTLIGLFALPFIWWLLRVTPPRPQRETFPPLRILQDVVTEEETPNSTPWWLLLLRMLMIALLAIGLARPILTQPEGVDQRPLTLIIDNGWDAAVNWGAILKDAEARINDARRKNVEVLLLTTAPSHDDNAPTQQAAPAFGPAARAVKTLKSLTPEAVNPDHAKLGKTLDTLDISTSEAVWLSSGYDFGTADHLGKAMRRAASAERLAPLEDSLPLMPGRVEETAEGLRSIWWRTTQNSLRRATVTVHGRGGRVLERQDITFSAGSLTATADFSLPVELRHRISALRVSGQSAAGSVKLLDDSWSRPLIGLLNTGDDTGSPLLSEAFYTETALSPYADIFSGQLQDLLPVAPSIIIMPDADRVESAQLKEFVETGGLLIRFAGPKLAKRRDSLLPVALRDGGRALGGALTWEDPQNLANFTAGSPFFGLTVPQDFRVKRQVMAEPGADTDTKTWARLEDGSPIVTSATRGLGRIVLFHVTAGPDWSNLAFGGLYVDMLRRLLPLARARSVQNIGTQGDWVADRILTGFGQLEPPGPQVSTIANADFDTAEVSLQTPPGLYRQGTQRQALNMVDTPEDIGVIGPLPGVKTGRYGETTQRFISGWLLGLALAFLTLDVCVALLISGRLSNLHWRKFREISVTRVPMALLITGLVLGLSSADDAHAQTVSSKSTDTVAIAPALGLHLAYIETGNARIDDLSHAALTGLVKALGERTTIEASGVRAVVPGQDDLVYYPFLYFPVRRDAAALSAQASNALNAYMASGGTVVFDTQDQGDKAILGHATHPGLARVSEALDIPSLGPVPNDHVLTKSFYLTQVFPGRWANGTVWVDKNRNGASQDGVSSVIIGSQDWAAGWAIDTDGIPIIDIENDIARQREMSIRFGVNLTMYALAGNYKADQVHAAALIERLGTVDKTPENLGPQGGPQ